MGDIEVKSYDNVSQVAVGGCSKHSTITNLVGNNPMMQRRFPAYTLMLYCGEVMYPTRCEKSDLLVRGSYTTVILWRSDTPGPGSEVEKKTMEKSCEKE